MTGWAAVLAAAPRAPAVLLTAMFLVALPEARLDYAAACAVMAVLLAVLWKAVRTGWLARG